MRTAPAADSATQALDLAFVSCQDWQNGYWPAYRHLAAEELDLVIHLGDYIYADGVAEEGTSPPGDFLARRANAFRAYYEQMPLRWSSLPVGAASQLYLRLTLGTLAQLNVLDTRQYRSDQPCGDGLKNCAGRLDPAQTMTGAQQEQWLLDGLAASHARWNVLAQQTIFAEVDFNPALGSVGPAGLFNVDQWDGYVAQRRRISEFLAVRRPANPIVLTGDIHSSWANDLKLD
jgi:alkaline phosphatase D